MLKTRVGDAIWLVQQPDHSRVAGYLAAHWGGENGFARPGFFAPCDAPELLRQEVVLAISEHDNGWWEWEAAPPIDAADGLPLGLVDVGRQNPEESLKRWRLGAPRLAENHPYVSLLISLHAYWLYAFAFPAEPGLDDTLRHPMFGLPERVTSLVPDPERTQAFLVEQKLTQQQLRERLRESPLWRAAVEPAHLNPHLKLLQVLDAVSLFLSFGAQQPLQLAHVPRGGWDDRATITLRPAGNHRLVCEPYPFDVDPLEVLLPARILPVGAATGIGSLESGPLVRLHSTPLQTIRFEVAGRG